MKMSNPRQLAVRVLVVTLTMLLNTASAETALNAPEELAEFIKNSLNQQPRLLAAQADISAAQANLSASGQAIYNPELELAYENAGTNTKTISISQTIDWRDQRSRRVGVANAELEIMSANYDITSNDHVSRVLKGLAEYQTAEQLQQLSDETLQLMQQFKSVSEQQYRAGDLNLIDLNLASLAYQQALMERAKVVSSKIESQESLRAIIGALPAMLPQLPEQLPQPLLEKNLDAFLLRLPTIRANLAKVKTFKQRVSLRKSEQAWDPTIGITAGSEGNDNLVGLNISIPLNVRNDFSAEVDVAYQQMIASEQQAQQEYRNMQANLIATTARYQNLLSAWDDWRNNSRDSVAQQLDLINQVWQAGDINTTDYLLQIKQALALKATGFELRNELWQTTFDWMMLTASADKWLAITISQEKLNEY